MELNMIDYKENKYLLLSFDDVERPWIQEIDAFGSNGILEQSTGRDRIAKDEDIERLADE